MSGSLFSDLFKRDKDVNEDVVKEIAKRKRYIDITGNWLNHPTDYLARILSQVVIKTLGM